VSIHGNGDVASVSGGSGELFLATTALQPMHGHRFGSSMGWVGLGWVG